MLVNTEYFRKAGLTFLKEGYYTKAPKETREYREFWIEERRKCIEGDSHGGLWIPGKMYSYLNYFPIMKTVKKEGGNKTAVKKLLLPDFWEIQLEWFTAKHIAWFGARYDEKNNRYYSTRGYDKNSDFLPEVELYPLKYNKLHPRDYEGGQHISCAKTRGCGFSYMDAAEGVHYYNFVPESKCFYIAYSDNFLTGKDGVLLKCWEGLNHLNEHTAWRKGRLVDKVDFKKSGYQKQGDSAKIDYGYKSQIMGIVADEPQKVKGARGIKITLEELGAFPDVYNTLHELLALINDGSYVIGQISGFGTGISEDDEIKADKNLAGLELLFNNPDAEGFMEFVNGWEEGVQDSCGFFVPSYLADNKYITPNGDVMLEEAIKAWDAKYEEAKTSVNPRKYSNLTAQYPKVPSHIFNKNTTNPLPAQLAKDQINYIKANRMILGNILVGKFENTQGRLRFMPSDDVKAISEYPHKNDADLTGAVTIFHEPFRNKEGQIPGNLYFMVVDPFYLEDAKDKTSLWVATVWQRDNGFTDIKGNRRVATYVSRLENLPLCYMITDNLSTYYGDCDIQCEIAGGGKGLLDYLTRLRKTYKCCKEVIFDDAKDKKGYSNSYFMRMNTDRKNQGLTYYRDWLIEPIGLTEDGNEILNIHQIYDIPLLQEISKFNYTGNFDRISADILAMFMLKERAEQQIRELNKGSDFFNRPLFTNGGNPNSGKSAFLSKY